MALTRTTTASNIINRAAVEMGLTASADPYSSVDENYVLLRALLNTAGEELASAFQWEFLTRQAQVQTVDGDTGDYPLPEDFLYMIPQTGWERSNRVPLFGPLSAQDWTWLEGRDLVGTTIYASFRIRDGLFSLFPQPPAEGLDITYEYQTKNWALDTTVTPPEPIEECDRSSDRVLFDKVLISRLLKVKYYEAKGLDSTKAMDDFAQQFSFITNVDKSGEILSAGRTRRGFPYLDGWRNVPDTGYGH